MQASPTVNRSGFFFIARDCAGLSGRAPAVHPVRLPEADPSEGRSAARPDCNHDPRKRVLKDFSPDYLDPRDSGWLLIWLYKIDRDLAVAGSENPAQSQQLQRMRSGRKSPLRFSEHSQQVLQGSRFPETQESRAAVSWAADRCGHRFLYGVCHLGDNLRERPNLYRRAATWRKTRPSASAESTTSTASRWQAIFTAPLFWAAAPAGENALPAAE
jgi:hypothetical protein